MAGGGWGLGGGRPGGLTQRNFVAAAPGAQSGRRARVDSRRKAGEFAQPPTATRHPPPATRSLITTVTISGVRAVHAVRAVYTALGGVEGIAHAEVSLGRAVVEHDGRATPDRLCDAVALAGCEVVAIEEDRRSLPVL